MEKYNIGDYITLNTIIKDNIIYEVISSEKYSDKLIIKIIFPKYISKSLKESNVFSIKSSYTLKLLGNPKYQPQLKVLYG